jgi:hypothetical protein
MRTEEDKAKAELAIFEQFVQQSALPIVPGSVYNGDHLLKEPDILCTLKSGERLAFELTEEVAPEFAKALNKNESFAWGNDVIEATVRKKLCKEYHVECPVDLLIYTNGRTALSDDIIIAKIHPLLQCKGSGPFRKVWLFGVSVHEIAAD